MHARTHARTQTGNIDRSLGLYGSGRGDAGADVELHCGRAGGARDVERRAGRPGEGNVSVLNNINSRRPSLQVVVRVRVLVLLCEQIYYQSEIRINGKRTYQRMVGQLRTTSFVFASPTTKKQCCAILPKYSPVRQVHLFVRSSVVRTVQHAGTCTPCMTS